ncbi:hypothetical protein DFH07DRAFT_936976 [Mycena maculata]|uniref:Uncharacterized protein n=1 Tax=Mycena maculata TaxID=230809 RepID=A0AAD7NUT9_9AGAR|nr:hypothetical protein DFH07DRAFT_936976 [Mycena maculata]
MLPAISTLFLHKGESAALNPNWSGENSLDSVNDYTSLLSSSIGFGAGLEEFLVTADPSLALGSISASADSPPVDLPRSDDNSSGSLTVNLTQHEISSSEAQTFIGWEWQKSTTLWLNEGVSSEICHFSDQIKVGSKRTKVSHVERVTGLPSQFPFPSEATAFLIDVTNIPNLDSNATVDALLKDQVLMFTPEADRPAVVQGSTPMSLGSFSAVLTQKHSCRRSKPKCCGAYACESLAPEFTNVERRELDPNSRDRLVEAQLRTREIQDSTRTGQVLSFLKSISDWQCGAVDSTANRVCSGGKAVPKKLAQRRPNKNYVLVCSHRDVIQCPTGHRMLEIPDFIDEDLFLKAVNGEKIVEDEDQGDECCKVSSSRQGKKGRNICPFNHIKEGCPFEAKVVHLPCVAEMFVFIPHEDKHPELARKCIVTYAVAEKYKECVRKFGLGATVAKVEKAPSTKEILGGLTPSLYHLSLVSRDTKTKLINQVKSEPMNQARHENQTVESYISEQRILPDEKRYIYVSECEGRTAIFGIKHGIIKYIHKVRTLDCDTTFKPVVGKTNVYEINGWMPGVNAEVTLGRVWIKEELLALVRRLTNQKLGFVALHRSGTLLGFNADMETAPLLGMADTLIPTIDIPSVTEEVLDALALIKWIVRICYSHIKRGIPDISYLPREDQDRIHNFMYIETSEDVEEFKLWIRTLPDPNGVLLRWWEQKEMHQWLLPTIIQCLSDMDPDDWHVIEATTNSEKPSMRRTMRKLGSEWGLSNHSYSTQPESIFLSASHSLRVFRYNILDTRRAAEIEIMLQSGNLHNPRNEVSHRYANRNRRRVHATEKAKQSRGEEEELLAAKEAVAVAQAHLKQIQAETNVRLILPGVFVPLDRGRISRPNPDDRGATRDPHRESSTAAVHANASSSDENITVSTLTASEHATRSNRKRSGSTSLESDAPPKRLRLGPLKGWGAERDGVNISAVEYAQKHWSEFQDEYPEMLPSILPDDV